MIDFPVTIDVLLGAVLGFLIGACYSSMRRVKNLRGIETATGLMGDHCPRCRKDGTMRTVLIIRVCKICGANVKIEDRYGNLK